MARTSKKKSFMENLEPAINPAMQFISGQPQQDETEAPVNPPEATLPEEEISSPPTPRQQPIASKEEPPEGYRFNPLFIEKKSKRVQLLMQPSLFERIKRQADARGTSINDYIHTLLDGATREEQA